MKNDCNIIQISNPFLGKPAYVTASSPCEKVCQPCNLQVSPPDVIHPAEVEEPLTPPCFAIVFSTNPSVVLEQFTYNAQSDSYTSPSGATAYYDSALGYIVSTTFGDYRASPASLNPINSYTRANGDALTTVLCASVPPPIPVVPTCVKTAYADDPAIVLGQWAANGTTAYDPVLPAQGSMTYGPVVGWRILIGTTYYSGGKDQNVPTGIFTAPNGKTILVRPCLT